ncbi:MAG: hypothetical protein LBQ52_04885 [Helicobacteraceae bacterium]|jgi:hypothetical protein|nr:hypothetical protein [Helicobacteraceae bacterium]
MMDNIRFFIRIFPMLLILAFMLPVDNLFSQVPEQPNNMPEASRVEGGGGLLIVPDANPYKMLFVNVGLGLWRGENAEVICYKAIGGTYFRCWLKKDIK